MSSFLLLFSRHQYFGFRVFQCASEAVRRSIFSMSSQAARVVCSFCGAGYSSAHGVSIHIGRNRSCKEARDLALRASSSQPPTPAIPVYLSSSVSPTSTTTAIPTQGLLITELSSENFCKWLAHQKCTSKLVTHIPKGARKHAAGKLLELVTAVVSNNSEDSWRALLAFAYKALRLPVGHSEQDRKFSYPAVIRKNIDEFNLSSIVPIPVNTSTGNTPRSSAILRSLDQASAKRASIKLNNEGDIRGAIRALISTDTFLPHNEETLGILKSKHPSPLPDQVYPAAPALDSPISCVSDDEFMRALASFKPGSAAGLSGLTALHIKQLTSKESGEVAQKLRRALAQLSEILIIGRAPDSVAEYLHGARLLAFLKKCGGTRPIAVGDVFRRLAAKIVCFRERESVGSYLRPRQFGFATRGGSEIVVHTAREFINSNTQCVAFKVDFRNAFNEASRSNILHQVHERAPGALPMLFQCYRNESVLMFHESKVSSQSGVQQGDPLGPMAFCLGIQPMVESLTSGLNLWYLDDGILAGSPEAVLRDICIILSSRPSTGLSLNSSKCELFLKGFDQSERLRITALFHAVLPSVRIIDETNFELLGSAVLEETIPDLISKKAAQISALCSKLRFMDPPSSLFLLSHCFLVPKITHRALANRFGFLPNYYGSMMSSSKPSGSL